MYKPTTALDKILKLKKRIRAISGGTGASKTVAILQILIDYAQCHSNQIIDVMSESYPHLEGGAIQEFKSIMLAHGYWDDNRWNGTKHEYTFETTTVIHFISIDKLGKAHGPRRDVLFINECNNIAWPIVDQLITRTRRHVFLDWNPSAEFWFYSEMLGKRDDIDFIGDGGQYPPLTYLDNEALDPGQLNEILAHRHNANWWKVYGEGKLGDVETRIFRGWNIIDEIPHEARLERYGVDFGFTNDPTAIVAVYYFNGGYLVDELAYTKGLSAKQIADILLNEKRALVIADSADPRTIAEIRTYGLNVTGAVKRPGETKSDPYIRWSIGVVQDQRISITKRSTNIIKEYRNYLWLTDKDGKILNEPDHLWSHSMDAIRYAIVSLAPMIRRKEMLEAMPRYPTPPRANIAV